jgi:glycerophosphoryl diester phosphodiesterase
VDTWNTLDGQPSRIIAHRGASGYRPEHTLDGYALAVVQGADVIEPDLVMSRDGVLFARHDLGLARSTDVAQHGEFAARARELAGQRDWWVGDFSAAEIDRLRSIQPWPARPHEFDGHLIVPRFGQILQLAREAGLQRGSAIPVYPELKHPEYFHALGLDPVAALQQELQHHEMLGPQAPVWLQCFDHAVLREAHARCGNPSFALLESIPPIGPERTARLRQFVGWASGVAPGKYLLWDGAGKSSGLVEEAHDLGLAVHSWTFREDTAPAPFATVQEELHAAFALGVDALFCDFPDVAIRHRAAYRTAVTD